MFYINTIFYREVIAMHTLENDVLTIEVSEHGAELQSIYHKNNEKEYLWQGDSEYWSRRSPILFPIVGKLANNSYYVKGRDYHLTQHGFARDLDFELIEKTDNKLKFMLKANEKTMLIYPYDFKLTVSYYLEDSKISVKYKVYNNSTELMYFSIGAHPALNTNLSENGIEDYYLDFGHELTLNTKIIDKEVGLMSFDEEVILERAQNLDLKYYMFKNDALVFEDINEVTLKNKINDEEIQLKCEGFPLLGIWTAKANCPFLALEPWYGMADYVGQPKEIRDKEYIQSVYPDDKFVCMYSLEIK